VTITPCTSDLLPGAALRHLGYTEREAQFIELAALHSGYFVRRQFTTFINQPRGGIAAAFLQKLLDQRHATAYVCRPQAHLYHLSAKPLYTALGQVDNRHRRRRPALGIKAKLMALDYVLARRADRFLPTEQERVEYFDRLGIERRLLPQAIYRPRERGTSTARYFVEKFPLSVQDSDASRVVTVTYVDAGDYTMDSFETFLERYSGLLRALPRVRLVHVSDSKHHVDAARARFMSWRQAGATLIVPRDDSAVDQFLSLFPLRRQIETGDLTPVSIAQLQQFRRERARLETIEGQRLYRLWMESGEVAVRDALRQMQGDGLDGEIEFATCCLPYDYGFLRGATDGL